MSKVTSLLASVQETIHTPEEQSYFWTHEVRYKIILEKILHIGGDKKLTILDIGCYPYHIGYALELLGHAVYGISSYHEKIKKKQVSILNIETEEFPYSDNFFDLVLCNEVIEHLPQSPVIVFKQIHRVTKKNGFAMITSPNIARSINRAKLLFGKTIMYPISVYFEEGGKGNNIYHRHNREYTLLELVSLFQQTGWRLMGKSLFISYTPFRRRVLKDPWWITTGKFVNTMVMIAVPSLRDTLFVLGQK